MTPHYSDPWLTVYAGDCRDVLPTLPADSVDCVVTSPPYWGLRDYGQDGQLGLEPTPEEYVANLVAVFREVRRVLKPSGTCWLNLGDSYAGNGQTQPQMGDALPPSLNGAPKVGMHGDLFTRTRAGKVRVASLKPKDLVGIPWRVAFALQADGWYLRSDIIWSKPNPMPESVTDRPTKAHEYVFLLTKSARYYYDADAVREPNTTPVAADGRFLDAYGRPQARRTDPGLRSDEIKATQNGKGDPRGVMEFANPAGRNLRSVWTIATRPYADAHFAVFPPELPERCIKAGSPENGLVLDCFAGSGTVGLVANRLSRRAVLIDLNPDYLRQQMRRNAQTPLGLSS